MGFPDNFLFIRDQEIYFSQTHLHLIFFALALGFFFCWSRYKRNALVLSLGITFALTATPVLYLISTKAGLVGDKYYLAFMALPMIPMMASVCAELMVGQKNYQKVLVLIMLAFVVFANSKFEIEYPNGYMPNCVKDNETAEIHDFLQEQGINRIMVTDSLGNRLRSEDTDISVVFGEGYDIPASSELYRILPTSEMYGCVAIAIQKKYDDPAYITAASNYRSGLETEHYHIYIR